MEARPPRTRLLSRETLAADRLIVVAERAIYIVVAGLLVIAAAFTLVGTAVDLVQGKSSRSIVDAGLFVLDRVLLLVIFAELLYTLREVNLGGRILVEPFVFIGVIAAVRRILVLTANVEQNHAQVKDAILQIGVLAGLILILVVSIYLLRRSGVKQEP
jgi:uncharacterized membrane protein (DUF373 family)